MNFNNFNPNNILPTSSSSINFQENFEGNPSSGSEDSRTTSSISSTATHVFQNSKFNLQHVIEKGQKHHFSKVWDILHKEHSSNAIRTRTAAVLGMAKLVVQWGFNPSHNIEKTESDLLDHLTCLINTRSQDVKIQRRIGHAHIWKGRLLCRQAKRCYDYIRKTDLFTQAWEQYTLSSSFNITSSHEVWRAEMIVRFDFLPILNEETGQRMNRQQAFELASQLLKITDDASPVQPKLRDLIQLAKEKINCFSSPSNGAGTIIPPIYEQEKREERIEDLISRPEYVPHLKNLKNDLITQIISKSANIIGAPQSETLDQMNNVGPIKVSSKRNWNSLDLEKQEVSNKSLASSVAQLDGSAIFGAIGVLSLTPKCERNLVDEDGNHHCFYELLLDGTDNNSGFNGFGVKRNSVIPQIIEELPHRPDLAHLISREVYSVFLNQNTKVSLPGNLTQTDNYKALQEDYENAINLAHVSGFQANKLLENQNSLPGPEVLIQMEQRLSTSADSFLKSRLEELTEDLKKALRAVEDVKRRIADFCNDPVMIQQFLDGYYIEEKSTNRWKYKNALTFIPGQSTTMDAIAFRQGVQLEIYGENMNLLHRSARPLGETFPIVRLIHQGNDYRVGHFNLLVSADDYTNMTVDSDQMTPRDKRQLMRSLKKS